MTEPTGDVHGENTCADVEAMLTDALDESRMVIAADAARQAEMDMLRMEVTRTRALMGEMRKKVGNLADQREGMDDQVAILYAELEAAERDAVPADSLTFAVISRSEVLAAYRAASKVTRGPLPPAVAAAVDAATEEIREAMAEAGRAALTAAVTRAVRARNVSQGRTPTGRRPRAAAQARKAA